MPRTWRGQGWSKVVERGALRYASTLSFAGKTITYDREFVSDAPTHPATDAQGYRDVVAQLTQNQLSLYARERFGRIWPVGRKPSAWRIIYFAFVTALLLVMIVGRLRR